MVHLDSMCFHLLSIRMEVNDIVVGDGEIGDPVIKMNTSEVFTSASDVV